MGDVDRQAIALLESLLTSKDLMALWRRLNHGGELEEAMRGNAYLLAGAVLCCRGGNISWKSSIYVTAAATRVSSIIHRSPTGTQ